MEKVYLNVYKPKKLLWKFLDEIDNNNNDSTEIFLVPSIQTFCVCENNEDVFIDTYIPIYLKEDLPKGLQDPYELFISLKINGEGIYEIIFPENFSDDSLVQLYPAEDIEFFNESEEFLKIECISIRNIEEDEILESYINMFTPPPPPNLN